MLQELFSQIAYVLTTHGKISDKLSYAFEMYDIDNDGYLTHSEVQDVIEAMLIMVGCDFSKPRVMKITEYCMDFLDIKKDGKITRGLLS